jgi:hypothetical protein
MFIKVAFAPCGDRRIPMMDGTSDAAYRTAVRFSIFVLVPSPGAMAPG